MPTLINCVRILLLSFLLFSLITLKAQKETPYQLNKRSDKDILISSAGTYLIGLYMKETIRPMSITEINNKQIGELNFLDRQSWNGSSRIARNRSDVLLRIGLATPFFMAFDQEVRRDYLENAVLFAEVILINNAVADWTKALSRKARPYVYQSDVPIENKEGISAVHSFFSGHSSTVASYTFFTYHLMRQYSDNSWLKGGTLAFAVILPTYTSILRVQAGKHFPTDVIAGSLIGAIIGYGVPEWHLKKAQKHAQNSLFISQTWNGIQLRYTLK